MCTSRLEEPPRGFFRQFFSCIMSPAGGQRDERDEGMARKRPANPAHSRPVPDAKRRKQEHATTAGADNAIPVPEISNVVSTFTCNTKLDLLKISQDHGLEFQVRAPQASRSVFFLPFLIFALTRILTLVLSALYLCGSRLASPRALFGSAGLPADPPRSRSRAESECLVVPLCLFLLCHRHTHSLFCNSFFVFARTAQICDYGLHERVGEPSGVERVCAPSVHFGRAH